MAELTVNEVLADLLELTDQWDRDARDRYYNKTDYERGFEDGWCYAADLLRGFVGVHQRRSVGSSETP
jgi:hypothetical protein